MNPNIHGQHIRSLPAKQSTGIALMVGSHVHGKRSFTDRYPYTTGLLLVVAEALCVCWVLTHSGCAHPIGNGIAAFIGFMVLPLIVVHLLEKGN